MATRLSATTPGALATSNIESNGCEWSDLGHARVARYPHHLRPILLAGSSQWQPGHQLLSTTRPTPISNRATDASRTTWGTPILLDNSGDTGQYTSLRVANGLPIISYYNVTNSDLRYVQATNVAGSTWGTPVTLESSGGVGTYTSLLGSSGNLFISYFDSDNRAT